MEALFNGLQCISDMCVAQRAQAQQGSAPAHQQAHMPSACGAQGGMQYVPVGMMQLQPVVAMT
eukprot:1726224-Karenia_brevis.AAC.1